MNNIVNLIDAVQVDPKLKGVPNKWWSDEKKSPPGIMVEFVSDGLDPDVLVDGEIDYDELGNGIVYE